MLSTLSRRALASRGLLGATSRHVRPTVAPAAAFHSGACVCLWWVWEGPWLGGRLGLGENGFGGRRGYVRSRPPQAVVIDDGGYANTHKTKKDLSTDRSNQTTT